MKVKTSKGFTLAELLIVMAIIVVLAAVAIPTFGRQLETARETNDMGLLRDIYTDVLSIAVQDGSDGKLDGKIGDLSITVAGITPAVATTDSTKDEKYTVALATYGSKATFTQAGTLAVGTAADSDTGAWKYVNPKLVGLTVPPVNTTTASLEFIFEINADGEVAPKAATVKIAGTDNATCLFTPA